MSVALRENDVLSFPVKLRTVVCCNCGIPFGVPVVIDDGLRDNHKDFFCPNGHKQHYIGKSETERLKEEVERLESKADWFRSNYRHAERARIAQKAAKTRAQNKLKRLEQRTAAGVCPCCNRTFKQLARHMKSKHPDWSE